jgi:hypothetical protein
MNNHSETAYDWKAPLACSEAIAMPVVETLGIAGIPGKIVLAEALVNQLTAVTMRDLPDSLTVERTAEAFEAVAAIRVKQCRHKHVRGYESLHYKQIRYPAFLWPIIRAIGDIESPEDALILRVELAGDMLRFDDENYDWGKVEETLCAIDAYGLKHGLEMANALPKGKDGNMGVISFVIQGDKLTSHTSVKNPADALVRATTDYVFGSYVWGTPRWEYNTVNWYRRQLRGVVTDAFRPVRCGG